MKFTLKLKIDSAEELASFIHGMNMEVDMSFLGNEMHNNDTILDLTKMLVEKQDAILMLESQVNDLRKSNQNLLVDLKQSIKSKTVNYEDEHFIPADHRNQEENPLPDQDEQVEMHNQDVVPKPELESKQDQETISKPETVKKHKSPFANLKPKACAECGFMFKPNHNRVKSCETCRSKKVKSPQIASD